MAEDASFRFRILARDKSARLGEISTPRGVIRTPAFMPVGTAATVKAMYAHDVAALGADVVLGNTYHLMLNPGAERIAALGGLHAFMQWDKPILTDSGGFQVMSLSKLRKLSENGVVFQSHIDGSRHELTPERAMEVQALLGSDIQMQFDECVRLPCSREEAERAMRLSLRWAERSRRAFAGGPGQAAFGIVQGGAERELRIESAQGAGGHGFPGPRHRRARGRRAAGGHARDDRDGRALSAAGQAALSDGRRHAGRSVAVARRGVDMFDCVMPTRAGRHGLAYTRNGRMNLKNAKFADDPRPIDATSLAYAGREFSRAYLRHLVKQGEILGMMALTAINIAYYQE